jgi:hypothetical protein
LRSTIHLFIKLCGRWNVLGRGRGRVEKLCPIHSGYGHMSGPSTTINHITSVSRCIALPKKKQNSSHHLPNRLPKSTPLWLTFIG